jgi:transcriptional regulator with XRE-family HTH domain
MVTRRRFDSRSTRALADAREALRTNVLVSRLQLRLSQAQLAERAGIARPVLSKIETASGDFQISALGSLAAALGCSIATLLTPEPIRPVLNHEIQKRLRDDPRRHVSGEVAWAAIDEANAGSKDMVARRLASGRTQRHVSNSPRQKPRK